MSYIITSRCMRDHHLVGMRLPPPKPADPEQHAMQPYVAWHDYLAETAWKERKVRLSGGPVITLRRGQVISAVGYWAKRWNWTEKTVRGWFAKLVNDGMIAFEGGSKGRLAKVATVCNYDAYQTGDAFKGQVDGHVEGTLRAGKGQHQIQDIQDIQDKQDSTDTSHQEQTYADGVGAPALELQVPKPKLTQTEVAKRCAEIYNQHAERHGYSKVLKLNTERIRNIFRRTHEFVEKGATIEEYVAVWERALGIAEKSAFLRGQTEVSFQMTIDFLCQKSSFLKLLEGKYGNGAAAKNAEAKRQANDKLARGQAAMAQMWEDAT